MHLDKDAKHFKKKLKAFFDVSQPDLCVGINTLPAYILAQFKPRCPFWADLNGWAMTEAQSQASVEKSNAYLPVTWKKESFILKTADQFSTVSLPQKYALYGELAVLGRLNSFTETYSFVHVVPNANELEKIPNQESHYILRGNVVPEDAFILFFSGVYNTWLDEEMLFEGVSGAMKKDPLIHFVSTGGIEKGLSDSVLRNFKKRIHKAKLSERFHFLGWMTKEDLILCYHRVDVALNIDRWNNETIFGARNRINEWIRYKVPVLSTIGTEISEELIESNCILGVTCGNAQDLTKKILQSQEINLEEMAERAFEFSEKYYSYRSTMIRFKRWFSSAVIAPDKNKIPGMKVRFFPRLLFRLKRDGFGFLFRWVKKRFF